MGEGSRVHLAKGLIHALPLSLLIRVERVRSDKRGVQIGWGEHYASSRTDTRTPASLIPPAQLVYDSLHEQARKHVLRYSVRPRGPYMEREEFRSSSGLCSNPIPRITEERPKRWSPCMCVMNMRFNLLHPKRCALSTSELPCPTLPRWDSLLKMHICRNVPMHKRTTMNASTLATIE